MPPSRKNPPARPPVRAKSALPAPRVAPKRVHIPWHRRSAVRALGGIVAAALLILVVIEGFSLWHHHRTTQATKAAVKRYDAEFQQELNPLSNFLNQATTSPQAFVAGTLPQAQFVTQTSQWLATFQALEKQLTSSNPPAPMVKARALLDQGAVLFIDSIKLDQLAAKTTDPATRAALVEQATNILAHAETVFADGAQEEAIAVNQYHLPLPSGITPSSLNGPPQLPQETVTATPAPATPAPAPS